MDEHDKRAREVLEKLHKRQRAGAFESDMGIMTAALRSTAAAAVAAERERQEREAGPRLLEATRRVGARHSAWIRRVLGEDAARRFDEYRGQSVMLAAPIAAAASPTQAERVSEEEAKKRNADTFNLGLRTGAATALLTERHRLAARLRARADEEERDGRDVQQFTVTERAARHRASLALRAEADALEVGT